MLTTLWVGALNNDAQLELPVESEDDPTYRMVGDPTEGAILVAAAKAGACHADLNQAYPRVQRGPLRLRTQAHGHHP